MELSYLVYFRTVAKTEHISQAAAELHITQPALSRAIGRVEQEVGAQLFERGANSIRLNHTGRAFLRRVEQILAEYDDAMREASDNSQVETGSVKLMAPTLELLTGFLRSYLPQHPDMQIFHQLAGPRDTMHELETHGADFALCPEPSGNPRIEWHPLFREQYCLAVSAQHPLAGEETVQLKDLSEERFVFNNGSSGFTGLLRGFCCRAGFEPKICFMGDETDFAYDLVAKNVGIMMVPVTQQVPIQNHALDLLGEELRFVWLEGPGCARVIGLSRLKNGYLTPTALAALEAVREYYTSLQPIRGFDILPRRSITD